jgi:hypothetical protein
MGKTKGNEDRKKGASRMVQLGYHQVQVWLDPKELAAVRAAHPSESLATLLRRLACEDAGHEFHYR